MSKWYFWRVDHKTGAVEEVRKWPEDALPIPPKADEIHYLTDNYHYFGEKNETETILGHFRRLYKNSQRESETESREGADQEERRHGSEEQRRVRA